MDSQQTSEPWGGLPPLAQELLRTMQCAQSRYSANNPEMSGIALVAVGAVLLAALRAQLAPGSLWAWWGAAMIPLSALAAAVVLLQRHRLNRYRGTVSGSIAAAGNIERLALGAGELPDIFSHTAYPWKLFLGRPPRTLAQQAKLLAHHLDWYLLREPRPYFRVDWAVYVLSAIPALYLVVVLAGLMALPGMQGRPPQDIALLALVLLLAVFITPLSLLANYNQTRQRIGIVELHRQLRERLEA